jgi:hypothetical protein
MIDEGKIWYVGGGTWARAVARRECVTKDEAVEQAKIEHEKGGHFHCDLIKMALLDKIHTPNIDQSILKAKAQDVKILEALTYTPLPLTTHNQTTSI